MDTRRAEQIARQISIAFPPEGMPAASAMIEDDVRMDPDTDEMIERLEGKTWKQLLEDLQSASGPDLLWWHSFYRFMTPQAFAYYLPAFMIVSLNAEHAEIVGLYLLLALDSNNRFGDPEWFHALTKCLTSDQEMAVSTFVKYALTLSYLGPEHQEYRDLRSYWGSPSASGAEPGPTP